MISKIVSDNIVRLMKQHNIGVNALGRKLVSLVSPATITKFTATPDDANPKISTIQHLSDAFKVSPWMLLTEEFPFDEIKKNKPLKRISADGYALLDLYEGASETARREILNYVAYQLRENPIAERKIRETQHRYAPSKANSPKPYPGCNEDFDP